MSAPLGGDFRDGPSSNAAAGNESKAAASKTAAASAAESGGTAGEAALNLDHMFEPVPLTSGGGYVCKTCRRIFHKRYQMTRHVRTHTGEKPFICFICRLSFSRRDILLRHCMNVHGMSKEQFQAQSSQWKFLVLRRWNHDFVRFFVIEK